MKLEQQVTSLELSKMLRELGVKQESLFYWVYVKNLKSWEIFSIHEEVSIDENDISAFTVAELGNVLSTTENNNQIRCTKALTQWCCDYETYRTFADTEADARAKMLIYLLENKLITI